MSDNEIRLRDLAREACRKHKSIEKAVTYVLDKLSADEKLMKALLSEMVKSAVTEAVYDARGNALHSLKYPSPGRCNRTPESIAAASAICASTILKSWILPDGRTLGDANGEELLSLAVQENGLAVGHSRNAAFYSRLGEKAGERTISSAMKPQAVWALWQSVCKTMKAAV